ncbi:LmbE-like protein [Solemya velum gill symbiont]|uniref:LmbE-like protein n=1 Tax=Solemya velum gill symbiont TaxID=2340 RepID=A0A0B0H8U0_SOVGS|nr:PIG-L family deacetylase [Solemya velum gill symbiont]KHF25082.1 LmbE-like protein [Solemya velum gill symbiont]
MNSSEHVICVVAHPDDEVLWFASILKEVDKVIFVFNDCVDAPGIGNKRTHAVGQLPYDNVTLAIPEAGTYDPMHWRHPKLSEFGLYLDRDAASRETLRLYERNYHSIKTQLESLIPEKSIVYTHNPWGEYGHADHVQVYRALSDIRDSLQLTLRVSPYISEQAEPLAQLYTESSSLPPERKPVDSDFTNQVVDIYQRSGCWTWADDWKWDEEMYLLPEPQLAKETNSLTNMVNSTYIKKIPSSVTK